MTKWMEAKTNVHIRWTEVRGPDANTKISLLLSSQKDLPDLILGFGTAADHYLYGSEGVLIPLDDLIQQYGYYIKRVEAYAPGYLADCASYDGRIYALQAYEECVHCTVAQKMWINATWLERLGLEMPDTPEAFRNVLRAFRDRDPNRNGQHDEIPLSGCIDEWHSAIDGFLMCAFIYDDGGDRLIVREDGTVVPAYVQLEWREGLRYLRSLYDEGLMDPQAFIQSFLQVWQLQESGLEPRVGAISIGHIGTVADSNGPVAQQYLAVPPLRGPRGVRVAAYYPVRPRDAENLVITKANRFPEATIKWGDLLFSEEASIRNWWGEEGVDWRRPRPGEKGDYGEPARFVLLGARPIYLEEMQDQAWIHGVPYFMPQRLFTGGLTPVPSSGAWNYERFLLQESRKYLPYVPGRVLPILRMAPDQVLEHAELRTVINSFVNQSIAKFITGAADLDRDWDAYLAEFDKMDVARYLRIVQQAIRTPEGREER
jgi:putative aldouronate transport system substrate-binding protein